MFCLCIMMQIRNNPYSCQKKSKRIYYSEAALLKFKSCGTWTLKPWMLCRIKPHEKASPKCAKFKRQVRQSNQIFLSMWFEHLIFGKEEDADCHFSKPCCLWVKNSLQICLLCQRKCKIMEKHEWSSFIFYFQDQKKQVYQFWRSETRNSY